MGAVERALEIEQRVSAATLRALAAQATELFTLVANNLRGQLRHAYE